MNGLVYHVASGQAFFSGAALVLLACLLSMHPKRFAQRLSLLLVIIGLIAVAVSSTPLPYWFVAFLVAVTVLWLVSRSHQRWRWFSMGAALLWFLAIVWEAPYHVVPSINRASSRSLTIIGDSVTAGMGDRETETWPIYMSDTHDIQIQDLSFPGATTKSALAKVKASDIASPVVLLEIGGNDVLGTTTAQDYARNLEALLAYLHVAGRQIVMFELPLPPFSHSFGHAQRTLANKYAVVLIPKRMFLDVLADENNTLDTIHLSKLGHERMADLVWRILEPAYSDSKL